MKMALRISSERRAKGKEKRLLIKAIDAIEQSLI